MYLYSVLCTIFLYLFISVAPARSAVIVVDKNYMASELSGVKRTFNQISGAVSYLSPGDILYIKRGVYNESLIFSKSGTEKKPITIRAYPGDEGKVIISGSDIVADWLKVRGSIWKTKISLDLATSYPEMWEKTDEIQNRSEMVFVGNNSLKQVLSINELGMNCFFYDKSKQELFINIIDTPKTKKVNVSVRKRGIFIEGSYLILSGIIVKHVANSHDFAAFYVRGRYNKIFNNQSIYNNMDGFQIVGRYMEISNNVASHNGRTGISYSGSNSLLKENTTNFNSWRFGPFIHSGGIKIVGGAPSNNKIIRHVSENNIGQGLWLDYGCKDNIVSGGKFINNLLYGIHVEACSRNTTLANNIICKTRPLPYFDPRNKHAGSGVMIYESQSTKVVNNVIADNASYGITVSGGERFIKYDNETIVCRDSEIYHNIIVNNSGGAIRFNFWNQSKLNHFKESHRHDFNILFSKSSIPLITADDGVSFFILKAFQEKYRNELNSVVVSPVFIDSHNNDYRLNINATQDLFVKSDCKIFSRIIKPIVKYNLNL